METFNGNNEEEVNMFTPESSETDEPKAPTKDPKPAKTNIKLKAVMVDDDELLIEELSDASDTEEKENIGLLAKPPTRKIPQLKGKLVFREATPAANKTKPSNTRPESSRTRDDAPKTPRQPNKARDKTPETRHEPIKTRTKTSKTRYVKVPRITLKRIHSKVTRLERRSASSSKARRTRDVELLKIVTKMAQQLTTADLKLNHLADRYRKLAEDVASAAQTETAHYQTLWSEIFKIHDHVKAAKRDVMMEIAHCSEGTTRDVETRVSGLLGDIKVSLATDPPPPPAEQKPTRVLANCVFCDVPHLYQECPTCTTPATKRDALRQRNTCIICFKPSHAANDPCPWTDKICAYCRNPGHNWVICGRAPHHTCDESDPATDPSTHHPHGKPRQAIRRSQKRPAPVDGHSTEPKIGTRKWPAKPVNDPASNQKSARPPRPPVHTRYYNPQGPSSSGFPSTM